VQTEDVQTVYDACRAYVKNRQTAKGQACAQDAEKRFERTVYGMWNFQVSDTDLCAGWI